MREQTGPTMEEQSNVRFGNYELVNRIDVGGMGEVYLAHQRTAFGRPVAIKIIRSDLVHDLTARARFLREAEVGAYLKHEHILQLIEFGEEQGRLFLVTPYIEGGTLARRLESGPLTLEEVYQLFPPLVQAVAYIHRRGVVHRDLKPTNILLDDEDGQIYVRLIDFGIATLQGHAASPPLTTAGNEVGTIAYMAPERLSGIAAPSNDIFSLGIILYEMLTGHLPSSTRQQTTTRLPGPFVLVIRRCLATRPEDRYSNADELLKAFLDAYEQVTALRASQTPPPTSPFNRDAARSQSLEALARNSDAQAQLVSLQNSGEFPAVAAPQPARKRVPVGVDFEAEDYSAPTTTFSEPEYRQAARPHISRPPLIASPSRRPPRPPKQGGRSVVFIMTGLIVLILIVISGMLFYGYQTVMATAVTINFSPKTMALSQVYTITANPALQATDVANVQIPARTLSSTKQQQQTGPTTGQVNCVLIVYQCQQGVSVSDVNNLVTQMQPVLERQIKQDLTGKLAAMRGTQIGAIKFTPQSVVANPPVGSVSQTVTVTMIEEGSVGYVVNADAENLTRQLLARQVHQLGPNYTLLSTTVRIGAMKVGKPNVASGGITLKVPAGGVAQYQFSNAELQGMIAGLKGKSLKVAHTYLEQRSGVDPASIAINFTTGNSDTLPTDAQHIKIVPVNPSSIPPISLTQIAGITPATRASRPWDI